MPPLRRLPRRRFLQSSAIALAATAVGATRTVRAASTTRPVHVAFIGLGRRAESLLPECLAYGGKVVALCDPDERQLVGPAAQVGAPRLYDDYRTLLRESKDIDAVVIATPDHWHAPLCRAALRAGKHVYCEKPLTRTIAEARELQALARRSPVVTQLGNQGSAFATLRRSIELVRAGALGRISEVHTWMKAGTANPAHDPAGADPIPAGFNWDLWLGPAPVRPYREGVYHPARWRYWYDFGSGRLGDFGCHGFNLPMRALDLVHPERIEFDAPHVSPHRYISGTGVRLHFPARGRLAPLVLHWHDGEGTVPSSRLDPLLAVYKKTPPSGCLLVGERGFIHATIWGENAVIQLNGETRPRGVLEHEATKHVPVSLPRVANHMEEWLHACLGRGRTFSDFEVGGRLTEISLAGTIALRVGRAVAWDGAKMCIPGLTAADRLVRNEDRPQWL
jgi:predicted dehydrogenase